MNKKIISIAKKKESYPIYIGSNILSEIQKEINFPRYSQFAIICDKNLSHKVSEIENILPHKPTIVIIDPGEQNKTIDTAQKIWKSLIDSKFDRKSLVINLGGGVIGDMGGFTAATYMRGIDFIQIPTSLLAMVDASVGGKLAVDFGGFKNIIGSFTQPKAVVIDIEFLTTLPDREYISGFAEIIKHGLIADKKYFETVTAKTPKEFSAEEMVTIISHSCEIKSEIVEKDEQESGTRKILNFGHTIGHAIESLSLKSDYKALLHGEAVAIGIIAEAKLSSLLGNFKENEFKKIKTAIQNAGLPINAFGMKKDNVLQTLIYDKKNEHGKIKWTLLKNIGESVFDIEVDKKLVEEAISYVIA